MAVTVRVLMGKLSTVASLIWSNNEKDMLVSLEKQLDTYFAILNPKLPKQIDSAPQLSYS